MLTRVHFLRYDILCLEGIARALRIFLMMEPVPVYKITKPKNPIRMSTKQVRARATRCTQACAFPLVNPFSFGWELKGFGEVCRIG